MRPDYSLRRRRKPPAPARGDNMYEWNRAAPTPREMDERLARAVCYEPAETFTAAELLARIWGTA
jgi:hypothetical protein